MPIDRPYHRIVRPSEEGFYTTGGRGHYVRHSAWATEPRSFIRGFTLLQTDLLSLFEYIEPEDSNVATYSLRIYALLLRICTEIETNFRAIFAANHYSKASRDLNMTDYWKIGRSHFLSGYQVRVHDWNGTARQRRPFEAWNAAIYQPLPWYQAYNASKHDRAGNLNSATLGPVVDAACALVVVLTAQFLFEDFTPSGDLLVESPADGFNNAIGGSHFAVRLPSPEEIPFEDRYVINVDQFASNPNPFQRFDYDAL